MENQRSTQIEEQTKNPTGKKKIEKKINELRGEVLILDELIRVVKVKSRILNRMKKNYKMKNFEDLAPLKETLKQKIQLKAERMKRCDKGSKFYRQNNTFKMDKKKFYRELGKTQVTVEKPPSKEEAEKFGAIIWGIEKEFNEKAEWLKREEERCEGLEQQEW